MGWSFTKNQSKRDLIQRLTSDATDHPMLASSTIGNHLWTVRRHPTLGLYIRLDLLSKEKGYGWGYKAMSEAMYPYYYTCPLRYLEIVPVANQEWRNAVINYHKRKKQTFTVGQRVKLYEREYTITAVLPDKKGYSLDNIYRMPMRMVKDAVAI